MPVFFPLKVVTRTFEMTLNENNYIKDMLDDLKKMYKCLITMFSLDILKRSA